MESNLAIVTGSSRGIGREIVARLLSDGYDVLGLSRSNSLDENFSTVKNGDSDRYRGFAVDISDPDQIENFFDFVKGEFGRVKVLVNNAGDLSQRGLGEISPQEAKYSLEVNFLGTFYCTQLASNLMVRGGSIVNIASVGGQIGGPKAPHYSAAKAAVISFTKSSARLLAPNVRVNGIAPGYIATDMWEYQLSVNQKDESEMVSEIPLGFVGQPTDVSDAVSFLISEQARYITGHILNVNGGTWMA